LTDIDLVESRTYKSVGGVGNIRLPSPTVLAGVNGAGKSHLLQAIEEGAVRANVNGSLIDLDDIALYDWTNFAVQNPAAATTWRIAQRRDQLWDTIRNQIAGGRVSQRIRTHHERVRAQLSQDQLLRVPIDSLGLDYEVAGAVDRERRAIHRELMEVLNGEQRELAHAIEGLTDKLIIELSRTDFSVAADLVAGRVDPLRLRTSELFLAYRSTLDHNDLLRLKSQHEDSTASYLSEAEFRSRYGPPPWDLLNDLLADLGLDFEVDKPQLGADSYNVTLVQRTSGSEVDFPDLSSGEKVLMALAISLYGSGEQRHRIKLPKLMLLDEVDAPLHPEMTRMYLRVVDELLVANGVSVILATHSPSTVALAPEGSIRRMSKTHPRIVEVTKQQALAHLTTGVTALTVRFNERRVVLVEGNSDADTYTAVLDALRPHIDAEYGLAFISGGMRVGEGGSDVVQRNVRILREAGAETIYGLIDRDTGNTASTDGTVLVLGPKGRYTIENYLLDPILLAALAVREKFSQVIDGLHEILGDTVGTWRGLDRCDSSALQRVSDRMLSMVDIHEQSRAEESTVAADLVGGQSINLPRWFVDMPGHRLTEAWMAAIPALRRYRDERGMRDAVVKLVVPDVPQLLSRDFLDVMVALAGHDPLGV
jgi:predicted ATPase